MAHNRESIVTLPLFNALTIAASGSAESSVIDLDALKSLGYFSIQVELTGDGTAQIEYLSSNDNVSYLVPASASDIVTAFTKTSGDGSDGNDLISYTPEPSKFQKIRITETGTTDSITVTITFCTQ